jgi:hypothetical protein
MFIKSISESFNNYSLDKASSGQDEGFISGAGRLPSLSSASERTVPKTTSRTKQSKPSAAKSSLIGDESSGSEEL